MKRKMGNYRVDFTKVTNKAYKRIDGLYQTEAVIRGDIEIGIEINPMCWTGDWLCEATFGKKAKQYRLLNVENHFSEDETCNRVMAVWEKI